MFKKSAYLGGPIDRVYIKDAKGWRNRLTKQLNKLGIEALNPLNKYGSDIKKIRSSLKLWQKNKNYDEMRKWGRKYIVDPDLKQVIDCSMVIIYLPPDTEVCGTYAELGLAYYYHKPIYIVSSRRRLPKWAIVCSTKIFGNFLELIDYLEELE